MSNNFLQLNSRKKEAILSQTTPQRWQQWSLSRLLTHSPLLCCHQSWCWVRLHTLSKPMSNPSARFPPSFHLQPIARLKPSRSKKNTAPPESSPVQKKSAHITPILAQLHWLPVHYRIHFKVLLLTYKTLNGQSPSYLSDLITT